MCTEIRFINSICGAMAYEYSEDDMKAIYTEVLKRLQHINCVWTLEGNVIYSSLVFAYGDYGTSPRSGWITDEKTKELFIEFLKREIHNIETLGEEE